MAALPTGTVTLLFSDIEGSTRLLGRMGDDYADLLARHRVLLRAAFEQHRGYVLESGGDAFFVAFASAGEAAAAAAEAQRALASHEWPRGNEIRVRIGLHTGEPRRIDGSYVGLDVHQAARVMAAAHGGQVLLSEPTQAVLDADVRLRDLGEHLLKDLAGPQRLYQLEVDGLPDDFPPLRTQVSRSSNLPALSSAFIGREHELAEAGALLARDDIRLLTLTGTGGAGKTRLAIELATGALARFPDGVFFVLLSPLRDAELVVPTIARTLALREQPGQSALETVIEHVREMQLLLLLDNVEQVVSAAPALATLLAEAPRLKLLVTSRTRLNLRGEQTYLVPQLGLPELHEELTATEVAGSESVRLFVERAQAAAPEFELDDANAGAVAEICVRLDGLPLALELTAPWLRTLTPQGLLSRLDGRLQLLTRGAQDADERQRTLRGAIDWSYELLPEQEQTLFARLAVFTGGFRLPAAEVVCADADSPAGEVLAGLDSLVEKSLLIRRMDPDGEPRLWMLETIREYAQERLETAGGLEDARRRHAGWFAEVAERLDAESRSGDQPAAVARLEADHSNLRAAMHWARERRDGELLLRLTIALWAFWSLRGYVAEGRAALEDALAVSGRRPARALLGLCTLRVLTGSSERLLDDLHEALRAAEELGDPLTLAQAWNLLGRIEGTLTGSMGRAEEAWRQALEYAESGDLRAERGESIGWLMMSANFGPLPVEEGIARCKRFNDEAGDDAFIRANACVERGALEAMRGDFRLARELIGEGLQTIAELGFPLQAAMSAQEAFYVEMLTADTAAAVRIMREAYAALESMGERGYLSTAAALLAHALCAEGKLDEAERFGGASQDAAAPDDVFTQVLWRSAVAKIRARRGAFTEAETLGREAVALAEQTDLLNTRGDTLADLAEVLALAGRRAEAIDLLQQAAERFDQKGNLSSLERVRQSARELVPATPLEAGGEAPCFTHVLCPECGVVLDGSPHRPGCAKKV